MCTRTRILGEWFGLVCSAEFCLSFGKITFTVQSIVTLPAEKKWTYEIKWNAILMQLDNFIDVFLARHVSGIYAHHQEHYKLSCSVGFSAPSFWMGGGLESRCVVRVYGADGAAWQHPHRTHDLRSGSQDHHPSKISVQKTICCISTSNAPDDGRMYPKHVELRIRQ